MNPSLCPHWEQKTNAKLAEALRYYLDSNNWKKHEKETKWIPRILREREDTIKKEASYPQTPPPALPVDAFGVTRGDNGRSRQRTHFVTMHIFKGVLQKLQHALSRHQSGFRYGH